MQINVHELDFKLKDIEDVAWGGHVSVAVENALFAIIEPFIKVFVNLFLGRGLPLDWLLKLLHLNFLNLDDAELEPFDGYFIFYVTPIFESSNALNSIQTSLFDTVGIEIPQICNSTQPPQQVSQKQLQDLAEIIDGQIGASIAKETLNTVRGALEKAVGMETPIDA